MKHRLKTSSIHQHIIIAFNWIQLNWNDMLIWRRKIYSIYKNYIDFVNELIVQVNIVFNFTVFFLSFFKVAMKNRFVDRMQPQNWCLNISSICVCVFTRLCHINTWDGLHWPKFHFVVLHESCGTVEREKYLMLLRNPMCRCWVMRIKRRHRHISDHTSSQILHCRYQKQKQQLSQRCVTLLFTVQYCKSLFLISITSNEVFINSFVLTFLNS